MYAEDDPLWRRYERACDFLEDDLESGYVRVLQEMIAAGWSDAGDRRGSREMLAGWYELLIEVARGSRRSSAVSARYHRPKRLPRRARRSSARRRCCCWASTVIRFRSGLACGASAS